MSPASHAERPSDATAAVQPIALPAEGAVLRRTVLSLTQTYDSRAADYDGSDHWPRDGRPSGAAESRERLAHTGERQIWVARDTAQSALARDVASYTRALRDGGMGPKQVLVAIAVVVRGAAAPSLAAESLDAIVHDAGRYCVEAYFAGRTPGHGQRPAGREE
jgi:hypothetical protein